MKCNLLALEVQRDRLEAFVATLLENADFEPFVDQKEDERGRKEGGGLAGRVEIRQGDANQLEEKNSYDWATLSHHLPPAAGMTEILLEHPASARRPRLSWTPTRRF